MVKELFQCSICEQTYPTRREAEECEATGQVTPTWAVGDLLVLEPEGQGRYTKFDGDPLWVWDTVLSANSSTGERHRLIYVVTAITYGGTLPFAGHYPVYHLATKAVLHEQHARGYLLHGEQGRFCPQKVERAGLDAADLLGQEAENPLPGA